MHQKKGVIDLAEEIIRHRRLYESGAPEISDAEYDRLESDLRELAPKHPVLDKVGAPASTGKVKHDKPMLSLEKTYSLASFEAWWKTQPVVAAEKIDGVSVSLIFEAGLLVQAKTRGNGYFGEDITSKIRWVSECCTELTQPISGEIRGELYCCERRFYELADEMAGLGQDRPTSPRNVVAGVLGRKQHPEFARYFNFFAFDAIFATPPFPPQEIEKIRWLEEQGFKCPNPKKLLSLDGISNYIDETRAHASSGEIGIDGVVFTLDDLKQHKLLGYTSHHPRYRMSFKWEGETATTRIKDFIWETSRLGIVTPVAVVEPVFLSQATIEHVSLHNAAHVKHHNLKIGDEVKIIRSGEVIPKFLSVTASQPGQHNFPECCLACGGQLEFDDVRLRCSNTQACSAQIAGRILNWVRQAKIDDLSDKRLGHLLEMGMVSAPRDLYKLELEDLLRLPLTKEKMASKLLENINRSRQMDATNFLSGLGIPGIGPVSWEKLLDKFGSLENLRHARVEDVLNVDGFAEKTAAQVVLGLKELEAEIEDLLAVGVEPLWQAATSGTALRGMTFVLTGALTRPRGEITKLIREAGGTVTGSVSANTTAVVSASTESSSSKFKKASELGIPIWSEETLFQKLGE